MEVLFPGTAWLGFLLTLLICGLLASYPMYGFAVAILFSLPAQLVYREPQAPSDWQAVSTHFGGVGLDTPSPLAEYEAAQSIQEMALSSSARVIRDTHKKRGMVLEGSHDRPDEEVLITRHVGDPPRTNPVSLARA